jgi:hypothetical protein
VFLLEYRKGCVHSVSPGVLLSAAQGVEGRALLTAEQRARYAEASLPLPTPAAALDAGVPDAAQVPTVQPARTLGLLGTPTAGDETKDTRPPSPASSVEPDIPGLIGPCKGGEAAIEERLTAEWLEIYIMELGHLSVPEFAFAPETSDPSVVELLTYLRGLLELAAPQLP